MSAGNFNPNNNSVLELVHLKQLHAVPGFTYETVSEKVREEVVSVQFNIAQYLIENSEFPVLLESYYDDVDCNNSSLMYNLVKKIIFPDGFPRSLKELNDIQKEFLYDQGAVKSLVYLELLPKLFKSISKQSSDEVDLEVTEGDYSKIFSFREEIALEHVKRAADLHYGNDQQGKVILVFGGGHDFQEECEQYRYKLIEVDFVSDQIKYDIKVNSHKELSSELKQLIEWHPYTTAKLLNSNYVSIEEVESLAKQDFVKLKNIICEAGLVDFVSQGLLPVSQLFNVYDSKNLKNHIWGIVKDGILSHEVSFDQLLKLSNNDLNLINDYQTVEDLKVFIVEALTHVSEQVKPEEDDINYLGYLYNTCHEYSLCGTVLSYFE